MPGLRVKAVTVLVIFCLAFTCTACSRKGGAEGLDNNAVITDPGADTGSDGSGTSGDGADAVSGVSDAESAIDQGNLSTDETDVGIGGNKDHIDESNSEILGSDSNALPLEAWVGDYSFTEYAPPDQNMFYSIYIYKESTSHYADIYIDGFQTMMRLKAEVIENGNRIDLMFDSYLPDNLMDIYEKGDHLLSLEKSGSKLLTYWGEIEPMLSDNIATGGAYFEKAEYPVLLMSFNVNFGMEESFEVIQLTDKTVTYSYYDYSDASNPVLKEKTVPFSEMLAKEDNGIDKFYMSIFLYDGYNVRELELTEKLTDRIKSDPEFRKRLGALIGKHFDRQLESDIIDVKDFE